MFIRQVSLPDVCKSCKNSEKKHHAKGYCLACYMRLIHRSKDKGLTDVSEERNIQE